MTVCDWPISEDFCVLVPSAFSHVGSPFPCEYAFLVIVPAQLPADQEPGAARPDCRDRHPHVTKYTCDVQLLEIWLSPLLAVDPLPYTCTSDLLFAVA